MNAELRDFIRRALRKCIEADGYLYQDIHIYLVPMVDGAGQIQSYDLTYSHEELQHELVHTIEAANYDEYKTIDAYQTDALIEALDDIATRYAEDLE